MATAFAVYCADDTSLSFYKRDTVPTAGSTFEGKIATDVYTGFEEAVYSDDLEVPWADWTADITAVSFVDKIQPNGVAYWFYGMQSLASADFRNLDLTNATTMKHMFYDCSSLTSVDLSGSNAISLTDVSFLFCKCGALNSLNLTGLDVSNVTTVVRMFADCAALPVVDLSGFDTSVVSNMNYMFENCKNLSTIYVSDLWSTEAMTKSTSMFTNCSALVGGNGTAYNSSVVDATYACVDTADAPGYFTYKRYVDRNIEYLIKAGTMIDIAESVRGLVGSTEPMSTAKVIETLSNIKQAEEVSF